MSFNLLLCWIIIGFDVHFDKIQRDVLLSKFHNLEPYVMFQVFHSTSWTSLKSQLRTLFILEMAVVGTPQNSFQKCCKNIGNSRVNIYLFLPLRLNAPSGLDNCTTFSIVKKKLSSLLKKKLFSLLEKIWKHFKRKISEACIENGGGNWEKLAISTASPLWTDVLPTTNATCEKKEKK